MERMSASTSGGTSDSTVIDLRSAVTDVLEGQIAAWRAVADELAAALEGRAEVEAALRAYRGLVALT